MKTPRKNLTDKEFNDTASRIFPEFNPDKHVMKRWQVPLLWMLYPLFGYKDTSESFALHYVKFRGTLYILKLEQK